MGCVEPLTRLYLVAAFHKSFVEAESSFRNHLLQSKEMVFEDAGQFCTRDRGA